MKSRKKGDGNLKLLVRSLRTKKYEKYKIQGDSLPVIQGEKSQKNQPQQ